MYDTRMLNCPNYSIVIDIQLLLLLLLNALQCPVLTAYYLLLFADPTQPSGDDTPKPNESSSSRTCKLCNL